MIEKFIRSNGQILCYQTFGDIRHAAILLIQGSGAQSILWLDKFCELLAAANFFVIRYDHRDTGMSSAVNFDENPYDLMQLTKDAKGILMGLGISQAHIIGSSMGGYIAQLLGIYYPKVVSTITLIMSSMISASLEHAFLDEIDNPFNLPLPTKEFSDAFLNISHANTFTEAKFVNYLISIWLVYNGQALPFDQNIWEQLGSLWYRRLKNGLNNINHRLAISNSPITREKELKNIKARTHIIHGDVDPFFTIEHAYALQNVIPNSHLSIVNKMGHLLHEAFVEEIAKQVLSNIGCRYESFKNSI